MTPSPADAVRVRTLRTPHEIASIYHLRDHIGLPQAVRDAPDFIAREKKRPVGSGRFL